MEVNLDEVNESVRFVVSGRVDERGSEILKQRFAQLDLNDLQEVIFDIKNVSHIGSAGIGKILLFYKDLASIGRTLRIENASDQIFDLLKMVKLDAIIPITKN